MLGLNQRKDQKVVHVVGKSPAYIHFIVNIVP
jgi:hypothetical protein